MSETPTASLSFFDTSSRELVTIHPASESEVGMYSCGPTVYKYAHIGNMRPYVTADIFARTIQAAGGLVRQVVNITDVGHLTSDGDTGEDKVAESARETGESAWDVARRFEQAYWDDTKTLLIRRPEIIARATEHIEDQIQLIAELAKRGYTYETPDGVYFDSSKFPGYGDFARLNLSGLNFGQRVDTRQKKHATDFALWKFPQKVGIREMEWESPWGVGFPGWHIECSAMAMRYLGSSFEIHTGGIDHIPVHHTNEIAQARAAGYDFARYWLHTDFLVDAQGEKMSKSSGSSLRLSEVVGQFGVSPMAIRYMYLTQHYRSPLEFSPERLEQCMRSITRLLDTATIIKYQADASSTPNNGFSDEAMRLWTEFQAKIRDDLNTPGALDAVQRMLNSKTIPPEEKYKLLADMDIALGLGVQESVKNVRLSDSQQAMLQQRQLARAHHDYIASDNIRLALSSEGVRVLDTPNGQQITRRELR